MLKKGREMSKRGSAGLGNLWLEGTLSHPWRSMAHSRLCFFKEKWIHQRTNSNLFIFLLQPQMSSAALETSLQQSNAVTGT